MGGLAVTNAESPLYIGRVVTSFAFFVRPADTNQYTAGDAVADSTTVANPMVFKDVVPTPNGSGVIQQANIAITANVAALQPDLQLYLYRTIPLMQGDNAAFAATNAQIGPASFVCCISFPVGAMVVTNAGSGAAGNVICNAQGLVIPFNASDSKALYGQLVMRNGYTPVSATQFTVSLNVVN